jgi:hypothetical protein
VIAFTKEEEKQYRAASRRVRKAAFGHFRKIQIAAPVKSTRKGPLDPQPLPVEPRPSSKEPRYGARDELFGKIVALRRKGVNRPQVAAELEISLSFLGKILTEAKKRGDLGNDCENCGNPTNRRFGVRLCHACDPACQRKKEVA